MKKRVGILISGRGSNMMALIEAARAPDYPAEIVVVISNRPEAPGLERARAAGSRRWPSTTRALPRARPSTRRWTTALLEAGVDLVCHGRLHAHPERRLRDALARAAAQHPSLAAASFKGLHPQQQALDAGVRISGCTVHFVTPEIEPGRSSPRRPCRCWPGTRPTRWPTRILAAEHRLYPHALRLVAAGRGQYSKAAGWCCKASVNQPDWLFSPAPRRAG